jgi:hypothetical protein
MATLTAIAAGTYSQQGVLKKKGLHYSQLATLIKKMYSSAAQLHQCMRAQSKIDRCVHTMVHIQLLTEEV